MLDEFIKDESGSASGEYGSVYLLVALGLFIVFTVFHHGISNAVGVIADDFVNKLDRMSVASEKNFNL
ncbi:MAG: hypothetical protein AB7W16_23240 [Candidatus Obscuribacterales bacterium]